MSNDATDDHRQAENIAASDTRQELTAGVPAKPKCHERNGDAMGILWLCSPATNAADQQFPEQNGDRSAEPDRAKQT